MLFNQIALEKKQLSGSVDLSSLHAALDTLILSEDKFSGKVDLTRLPQRICYLALRNNSFSGETDFNHFLESINRLSVEELISPGKSTQRGNDSAFSSLQI
ncbi:hypothetical protein XU18_1417 [Perkinsela sp. CCAP 1560/4]|nr:hypothetical protein XU18_1417 [Perkinsela sp. CCAP 1560/4]|eukprot:KNH07985.1 hypothetical protein XU18_1417 [Perkinsela sp. CCAP 1560/4]